MERSRFSYCSTAASLTSLTVAVATSPRVSGFSVLSMRELITATFDKDAGLRGTAYMMLRCRLWGRYASMFGFFKRKERVADAELKASAKNIATALSVSMRVSGGRIEDANGQLNRKALGYVYGFADAALQYRGMDMADVAVGVPFLYMVLNRLFEDNNRARAYANFLIDNVGKDATVMLGVMHGGQQYVDWRNGKMQPMGLGRFIIEGDPR
jgi:hypothetical protein